MTTADRMILPATKAHMDACARLWDAALPDMFAAAAGPSVQQRGFADQTAGEEIFVALTGDRVSGFSSLWRPGRFIHFLVVDKRLQRCGIGSTLLRHAVIELGRPVELKCEPHNGAACAFYEAHGWRQVERVEEGDAPFIRYRLDDGAG